MNTRGLTILSAVFRVLTWLLVALVALTTIITVIAIVRPSLFQSVSVSVPIGFAIEGAVGTVDIAANRFPVEVPHAVGRFTVRGDSRGMLAIVWLFVSVALGVAILATFQIRRLVQSAARGEPFEHGNHLIVRRLGWLALGLGVARSLYLLSTYLYTEGRLDSSLIHASLRFSPGGGYLVTGILLIALGEVFSRGERLQRDHDWGEADSGDVTTI